jgi:hypothetical protein
MKLNITLLVIMLGVAFFIAMLRVLMLSVVLLSVVAPSLDVQFIPYQVRPLFNKL